MSEYLKKRNTLISHQYKCNFSQTTESKINDFIQAADNEIAKLIAIIADYEQITGTFDTADELIEHLHSLEDKQ